MDEASRPSRRTLSSHFNVAKARAGSEDDRMPTRPQEREEGVVTAFRGALPAKFVAALM